MALFKGELCNCPSFETDSWTQVNTGTEIRKEAKCPICKNRAEEFVLMEITGMVEIPYWFGEVINKAEFSLTTNYAGFGEDGAIFDVEHFKANESP